MEEELSALRADLACKQMELSSLNADLDRARFQLANRPLHFTVGQYNMLAGYLGNNTEPWFLYGVDVCQDRRRRIAEKFVETDHLGQYINVGWPSYVRGILTDNEISTVEEVHDLCFTWEKRKDRIVKVIADLDVDLMSIVECDHYHDFFKPALDLMGYDSLWAQRPRKSSQDGCCIAWRRGSFECLASEVVEYKDPPKRQNGKRPQEDVNLIKDRIALLTLMRSKVTGDTLIFASTHLARNPEEKELDGLRSRQISQVIRGILAFSRRVDCRNSPVVLTGDLNATAFERLIGIASVAALLREGVPNPIGQAAQTVPLQTGAAVGPHRRTLVLL
jgi:mRNA deadenylase 3'-5' endonuclease subunit Ccr4